jgi:GNAT superfamily N-acetyltransferase
MALAIALSALDTARFGFRTARAEDVDAEDRPALVDFIRSNGMELVIARCASENIPARQMMSILGGFELDTIIYLTCDVSAYRALAYKTDIVVRPTRAADKDYLEYAGRRCFDEYFGHYHSDQRLDRGSVTAIYAEWASSFVNPPLDRFGLMALMNGKPVGFCGLTQTDDQLEGVLFGSLPEYRRQGIFGTLLDSAFAYAADHQVIRFNYSTQVQNIFIINRLIKCGFRLSCAKNTFHIWADDIKPDNPGHQAISPAGAG